MPTPGRRPRARARSAARLAQHGLFGLGVPVAEGGQGGSLGDALEAIAGVAGHSLTAGFVFWAQRAFVEYLLQSPNAALRQRWLPGLLQGTQAGATGLSNAMKYLGGIEALQVEATPVGTVGAVGADGLALRGRVPWATNLVPPGRFVVAVAVSRSDGARPFVAALPGDAAGLQRSADLDLIALRGSHTAALSIEGLQIGPADVIHADANHFLPRVRPAFMGLQLGLCIGWRAPRWRRPRPVPAPGAMCWEACCSSSATRWNWPRPRCMRACPTGVFLTDLKPCSACAWN